MHAGQTRVCHAGLRPRISAQTAEMMSANMIMDSDSSSSDEEDPTPVKRHTGMFCLCNLVLQNHITARSCMHKEPSTYSANFAFHN